MAQPVTIGAGMRHLVPSKLELSLSRSGVLADSSWSRSVHLNGLLIDLSLVEWVDIGALVQLVVLLDSAAKSSIQATVALPLTYSTPTEITTIEPSLLQNIIQKRTAARRFLDYMQLESALLGLSLSGQQQRPTLLDDMDPSATVSSSDAKREGELTSRIGNQLEPRYKHFFPLRWLSVGDDTETLTMARFLAGVIGQSERGLDSIDAKTISNVLLYELLENVAEHAGNDSRALVAAAGHSATLPILTWQHYSSERPYLTWLTQKREPLIDIVVADAGKGLSQALRRDYRAADASEKPTSLRDHTEDARTMLWAFHRWSTSKQRTRLRGTRGLYRVDRVVKKYQGLVTIRSSTELVGWDHGGPAHDKELVETAQPLPNVPGSLLRLRLPPFKESAFRHRSPARQNLGLRFHILSLGALGDMGLSASQLDALHSAFSYESPLCVIAILDGGCDTKSAVEETLRQAADLRHPGALVLVGLHGGWDLIENAVDSVNEEHERSARSVEWSQPNHYRIWDPVLVVGPAGQLAWSGATPNHQKLLNALTQEGGVLSHARLLELLPAPDERSRTLRELRADTYVATMQAGVGIRMRFGLEDVIDTLAAHVATNLKNHVDAAGDGVLSGEVCLTPSLSMVSKWLDVGVIVERACGSELAARVLAMKIQSRLLARSASAQVTLLGESTSSRTLLNALLRCVGAKRLEILPGETVAPVPLGVNVLVSGELIVIHTDILATGEGVRRLVRQVLRDAAQPVLASCIFDTRPNAGDSLDMWGVSIPVVSILTLDLSVATKLSPSVFISPITRRPETNRLQISRPPRLSRSTLIQLLIAQNALHFSHIGRPIGRHFTFYVDAKAMMQSASIAREFNAVIDEWSSTAQRSTHTGTTGIELWYPEPDPTSATPGGSFAALALPRTDVIASRTIHREPAYGRWFFTEAAPRSLTSGDVLIVDWGALTGATIHELIKMAAHAGAKRILVCIFLSQLPRQEEAFLSMLNTLDVPVRPGETTEQMVLFPTLVPTVSTMGTTAVRQASVSVRFLGRLQIEPFTASTCPVCQQLARIAQEVYPSEQLEAFAERQKHGRLHLRDRGDVLSLVPRDMDGRFLGGERAVEMAGFREVLNDALESTALRAKVRDTLSEHLANTAADGDQVPSTVLALLQFLAVETQWLRRPPLYLLELRATVAELARRVAVNNRIATEDRQSAAIVLRTCSKLDFAHNFYDLFRSACHIRELAEQILYDAFTYVVRPYHQSATVFAPLRDNLAKLVKEVKDESLALAPDLRETLLRLEIRSHAEHAKAGARALDSIQTWASLRRHFLKDYTVHDDVHEAITHMQPALDAEEVENLIEIWETGSSFEHKLPTGLEAWIRSLPAHWAMCQQFMDYTVLPLMIRLQAIFASEDGMRHLGPETVYRLLNLVDLIVEERTPLAESRLSRLIEQLEEAPEVLLSRDEWNFYKTEVRWWWDRILRAGREGARSSRFIEFISSAPCALGTTVASVYSESAERLPPHVIYGLDATVNADVSVFATESLVRATLRQALLNIRKHWSGSGPIDIWTELERDSAEWLLRISNSDTVYHENRSGGLAKLQRRLRPFGARLQYESRPQHENRTFELELRFREGALG